MGIATGSYLEFSDIGGGGYFIIDNLDLYCSQSVYIQGVNLTPALITNGDAIITGNLDVTSITGSLHGTATSASYVKPLSQSVYISGSLFVNGAISASILNVSVITSSVTTYTGSTIFGSSSSDTHQFTGSILTTGSVYVTGSIYTSGTLFGTSSYALSALSSSHSITSSYAITASYALNAAGASTTGSFTGSFTGSILTPLIRLTDGSFVRSQNYITQSSVLNNTTGTIWFAPSLEPSAFINYYASDSNYGGSFSEAGSIIMMSDTFTVGLYTSSVIPPSVPPGATLTFSGSLSGGGTILLYATVTGMNTQCDFVLDVKTLF